MKCFTWTPTDGITEGIAVSMQDGEGWVSLGNRHGDPRDVPFFNPNPPELDSQGRVHDVYLYQVEPRGGGRKFWTIAKPNNGAEGVIMRISTEARPVWGHHGTVRTLSGHPHYKVGGHGMSYKRDHREINSLYYEVLVILYKGDSLIVTPQGNDERVVISSDGSNVNVSSYQG